MLTQDELQWEMRNMVTIDIKDPSEKLISYFLDLVKRESQDFNSKNLLKTRIPIILRESIEKYIGIVAKDVFAQIEEINYWEKYEEDNLRSKYGIV
jgi:hypothetical protein